MKKVISFITAIAVMMSLVLTVSANTPAENQQIGWLIEGEFSLEFELPPTPAQVEAGTHGQRGILERKGGVVRVYNLNANGTYTEATNSAVMANFGRNFRLFSDDMEFIFTNNVMSEIRYNDTYIKVSNLKPEVSGIIPDTLSTKTQLWWIIDSARGNGEFSFNFELEDSEKGVVTGKDGDVKVYIFHHCNGAPVLIPDSPLMTVFAQNFKLLTQLAHNHNNEVTSGEPNSRPFPAPYPEWLGLTDNGVGFANGNYELFPLVSQATLNSAANPYEINLDAGFTMPRPADDPTRLNDMFFIYETVPGTTPIMSAMYFDGLWVKISHLANSAAGITDDLPCDGCENCEPTIETPDDTTTPDNTQNNVTNNDGNPETGMTISLIPMFIASAIAFVTRKRKS
jgi:hypothetical protein